MNIPTDELDEHGDEFVVSQSTYWLMIGLSMGGILLGCISGMLAWSANSTSHSLSSLIYDAKSNITTVNSSVTELQETISAMKKEHERDKTNAKSILDNLTSQVREQEKRIENLSNQSRLQDSEFSKYTDQLASINRHLASSMKSVRPEEGILGTWIGTLGLTPTESLEVRFVSELKDLATASKSEFDTETVLKKQQEMLIRHQAEIEQVFLKENTLGMKEVPRFYLLTFLPNGRAFIRIHDFRTPEFRYRLKKLDSGSILWNVDPPAMEGYLRSPDNLELHSFGLEIDGGNQLAYARHWDITRPDMTGELRLSSTKLFGTSFFTLGRDLRKVE